MLEQEKKADRKKKRFVARLKRSKGIICTDSPGPNIVLCNVGQATNLTKDCIHDIIKKTTPKISLPKFIAEKGESYSFLVFNDIEEALLFYNQWNGKTKVYEKGASIYMQFVENVPNLEIVCNHNTPNGLLLIDGFITPEKEQLFLKLFNFEESSNLKNRQVKHYGYEFRYGTNDVDLSTPLAEGIPKECDVLWQSLKEQGINVGVPDQLTVNKYNPGQGIPSHVDKHSPFGPTILSVSLGAPVVMEWRHHTGVLVPVVVPRRSLLVIRDEARYDWQHGIQPRTWDPIIRESSGQRVITDETRPRGVRLSLTFRWTRQGPCECPYKSLCDSAAGEIDDAVATRLEEVHVHQVYEQIAGHFSATRHTAWPRVAAFLRRVPTGAVVLDLGAGNGKNILQRDDIFQLAGERSGALAAACGARRRAWPADCVRLDAVAAPLRNACADAAICVAVVHHLSTRARRLQAIATISRLLRPGGSALITVWAKDQTRSNYLCKSRSPGEHRAVDVGGIRLPVHQNRTQFQHQDLLVPWKLRNDKQKDQTNQESTLLRYYHVFEQGELDALCEEVDFVVEDSFYEEGNWCVVCRNK